MKWDWPERRDPPEQAEAWGWRSRAAARRGWRWGGSRRSGTWGWPRCRRGAGRPVRPPSPPGAALQRGLVRGAKLREPAKSSPPTTELNINVFFYVLSLSFVSNKAALLIILEFTIYFKWERISRDDVISVQNQTMQNEYSISPNGRNEVGSRVKHLIKAAISILRKQLPLGHYAFK